MSLLIEGADMPERGIHHGAIVISETGNHLVVNSHPYNKCFALSEISTPHGDLIDRDKLIQLFLPIMEFPEDERIMYVDSFIRALKNAPTIIEAEEK